MAGELGAFEPLKDERLDDGRSYGGGNMVIEGVLATEAVGVRSAGGWSFELEAATSSLNRSLTLVITDSVSLAVDSRRKLRGRLCVLGVRLWRWPMRVFRPTAWTSRLPDLYEML